MAGKKRANGEGTIYQRADGRWEGAGYVQAPDGASRRSGSTALPASRPPTN
jgi:hypothetical protein